MTRVLILRQRLGTSSAMWLACSLAAFLPLLASSALAGVQNVPCQEPRVFTGASVNAVVLPYRYAGERNPRLSDSGVRLSLLLQRNTLFSMLQYRGIASVQLVDDNPSQPECNPDVIIEKLLGKRRGAESTVAEGRGVVFLWGFLYEEGSDVYVRSYASFQRRGREEELVVHVGDREFTGRLPAKTVAFAPRRLTTSDLEAVESEFRKFAEVRDRPDDAAPAKELPFDPDFPFDYQVDDSRGEWMHIKPLTRGLPGWVRAGARLGDLPLKRRLPELSFVEGAVGYLLCKMQSESGRQPVSSATAGRASQALARYLEVAGAESAPLAAAVVNAMLGELSVLASSQGQADERAYGHFQSAAELVAENAEARNLELIYRLALSYKGPPPARDVTKVADRWISAATMQTDNSHLLANLKQFYELVLYSPLDVTDTDPREEVRSRLKLLQQVISASGAQ